MYYRISRQNYASRGHSRSTYKHFHHVKEMPSTEKPCDLSTVINVQSLQNTSYSRYSTIKGKVRKKKQQQPTIAANGTVGFLPTFSISPLKFQMLCLATITGTFADGGNCFCCTLIPLLTVPAFRGCALFHTVKVLGLLTQCDSVPLLEDQKRCHSITHYWSSVLFIAQLTACSYHLVLQIKYKSSRFVFISSDDSYQPWLCSQVTRL